MHAAETSCKGIENNRILLYLCPENGPAAAGSCSLNNEMKILILNGPNLNLQGRRNLAVYGVGTLDDLAGRLAERYPDVAIVFITGLTTARDVINGYQSGADFYIKKPFLPEELDAHIQAVLKVKRSASMPEADGKDRYTIGKYSFFPSQNLLCDEDGYQRSLTPKEAKVLEMLCRRKGHLVSREEILIAIWQTADFYSSRSLDVFITKLRKYLAKDPHIGLKVQKGVGIELEDGL